MVNKYFALCQNLKLFLVDLRLKTLETKLKRIYFSNTSIVECMGFEYNKNVIVYELI